MGVSVQTESVENITSRFIDVEGASYMGGMIPHCRLTSVGRLSMRSRLCHLPSFCFKPDQLQAIPTRYHFTLYAKNISGSTQGYQYLCKGKQDCTLLRTSRLGRPQFDAYSEPPQEAAQVMDGGEAMTYSTTNVQAGSPKER